MVRPEAIVLSLTEPGYLRGEVLQCSFLGNCTRVAVAADGCDEPVLVELHGSDAEGLDRLAPGRRVWLSWGRKAAVVISDKEVRT